MIMTDERALISKIHSLPEDLKAEVARFVEKLKKRAEGEIDKPRIRRKAGNSVGTYHIAPDFDEPLDDFKEYM